MTTLEDIKSQKSYKYLQEVEEIAQNIITVKSEKLDLANTENKLREGLRVLKEVEDRNTWIKTGSVLIQRPTKECITILTDELQKVEIDMKNSHDLLRKLVHKMRDLEHEPRLEGFTLKPMSLSEAKVINKSFGNIS